MSKSDLELATQFLQALAAADEGGDRSGLYPFLATDVEWLTPRRDLHGIDEVRDQLTWISPRGNLDVEFDEPDLTDLGDGRILSDVHEVYRMKGTGEFAYTRDRRIELTIREGRIARYEMRITG
jgi:hypothetical protein